MYRGQSLRLSTQPSKILEEESYAQRKTAGVEKSMVAKGWPSKNGKLKPYYPSPSNTVKVLEVLSLFRRMVILLNNRHR